MGTWLLDQSGVAPFGNLATATEAWNHQHNIQKSNKLTRLGSGSYRTAYVHADEPGIVYKVSRYASENAAIMQQDEAYIIQTALRDPRDRDWVPQACYAWRIAEDDVVLAVAQVVRYEGELDNDWGYDDIQAVFRRLKLDDTHEKNWVRTGPRHAVIVDFGNNHVAWRHGAQEALKQWPQYPDSPEAPLPDLPTPRTRRVRLGDVATKLATTGYVRTINAAHAPVLVARKMPTINPEPDKPLPDPFRLPPDALSNIMKDFQAAWAAMNNQVLVRNYLRRLDQPERIYIDLPMR